MQPFSPLGESHAAGRKSWLDYFCWQMPVGLLILTFLVTNFIQLSDLVHQKANLQQGAKEIEKVLPRVELVRQKLDALARDIVVLAPTNAAARQIQEELRIQVSDGSNQPAAAPAPAPAASSPSAPERAPATSSSSEKKKP